MEIDQIKQYLQTQNITYEELSKTSKVPIGTLKSIFSGRTPTPRIDTMQRIEKALGLSPQWLAENQTSIITDTDKMTVTSAEMELVEIYRDIGRTQGEKAQRLVIKFAEMIFNNKD